MPTLDHAAIRRLPGPFVPFVAAVLVLAAAAGCATQPAEDAATAAARYRVVIASPIRTDQDRRTDAARRPAEFLPFTQVKPGMQAMDISAGGGYTTQLLALAVGPTGKVWAQTPQPSVALNKRLADQPQANITVVARPFDDPVPAEAPKLDLITIVLNYHDITYLPVDRAQMDRRLYAALKPGGRLVVVDHSAVADADIGVGKSLHRIDEAIVRNELKQAGFVLDAEGDYLRNPADPRTDTSNPPRTSPTDKFVLRFVRPM
ncbi:MAG: class I SAM-dependent methyltransferase [Betaproteobacteria bacterium]